MKLSIKVLVAFVLCFLIIGGIYFFNNNKVDVTKKKASFSVLSFTGESITNGTKVSFINFKGVRELYVLTMNKGDIVNIKYTSNGLKMAIVDDKYNIVKDFNVDVDNNYNLKCENRGKYFVRIYGKKESGNFQLQFNTKDDTKITEAKFWN
ncbi:hypothetical protein [Clostridium estertheticum]|uniref:Uncharacterized protein n=1 Tax=Clostridium estertheticum TaxID=238834 RepID=A0AA47I8D1_9CLOT|nr:hypothetical protein [Clostridium estertheticum]MBU3157338.1 hypothetical protein [Clostridium estertheticum]WAG62483.1 hypothetical protein LL038_09700 [Clostridium estertheticum]